MSAPRFVAARRELVDSESFYNRAVLQRLLPFVIGVAMSVPVFELLIPGTLF